MVDMLVWGRFRDVSWSSICNRPTVSWQFRHSASHAHPRHRSATIDLMETKTQIVGSTFRGVFPKCLLSLPRATAT